MNLLTGRQPRIAHLHTSVIRKSITTACLVSMANQQVRAAELEEQLNRSEALLGWESLLQMAFALIAVVGIIVILSMLIRRFSLLAGSSSGMIKILGGLALNNKDRLLLIQVGDEQILISASPGRVGKVHDLRTPVDPEQVTVSQKPEGNSFASLLDFAKRRSN